MKPKNKKATLGPGAHVAVKGELKSSIKHAERIGAKAIQIFGSTPLQWKTTKRSENEIREFIEELEKSDITQVFLHAPYLVNLASSKGDILKKSLTALKGHLDIAERAGAVGLIVHLGSLNGEGNNKAKAVEQIAKSVEDVLESVPGKSYFIMENTAGGGATYGINKEELGAIMDKVKSPRLKVCLDTAHAFASGILKFESEAEVSGFFDDWESVIGENNIVVLHANDSKAEFESKKDRHENIGEGHIGIKGFKNLAKDSRAREVPWILEVPGFAGVGPDKENIDKLKEVFKNA